METINSVKCPIHSEHEEISLFWEFSYADKTYHLFQCRKCHLAFYHPFPDINYENHTNSIESLKDYVHLNSNIEGLINNLLNHIPKEGYHSMVELGCGFGFTLDFAKRMLGIEVIGYEPSLYGEIGAAELGLNIQRTYFTNEMAQGQHDLVYLSEVLEHISEPKSFLSTLKKALNKHGVLILTTPDFELLEKDLNLPTDLALLSPGAHTILYSAGALEELLREVGFTQVEISHSNNSLLAVCAMEKKKWRLLENKVEILRDYYQELLESTKPSSLTYTGVLYRLFRNYVDYGLYEDAGKLIRQYPFPVLPSVTDIQKVTDSTAYGMLGASCNVLLAYYMGVMSLNHYMDYSEAAKFFHKSFLLCKRKLMLIPNSAVQEFEIVWLARYHEALCYFKLRDFTSCKSILKQIIGSPLSGAESAIPAPSNEVVNKARRLLDDIKTGI
jgi:SAM-dependent methyltransferase